MVDCDAQGFSHRVIFRCLPVKKELLQSVLTNHPPQFTVSDERDKHHE